ncbi:MAG: DNA-directed RNA polymerase subunit omega [Bacteroidetes bacterium]|nr:DNA-directed RNA polymerase subunit omega [Bacteroidota bacterium]
MASKNIETLDITALAAMTDNIYETVVISSRRARQLAARTKEELDTQLAYYDDLGLVEPAEELRTNEDQLKISIEFELRPKAGALALEELQNDEVYYRNAGPDSGATL